MNLDHLSNEELFKRAKELSKSPKEARPFAKELAQRQSIKTVDLSKCHGNGITSELRGRSHRRICGIYKS